MTVQPDLCWTCLETTLLVFPRGGSFQLHFLYVVAVIQHVCTIFRSVNEVICHGIPDSRKLEDGDIVNSK